MNVLTPTRRTRVRALVGLTTAALAAGAVLAPAAAHAGTPGTSAAIYGTADATWDGVYRHSLAMLGLNAAGATQDPAAVQWLLDQQCTNGGFVAFDADTSTHCTSAEGIDSNATAVAAQALIAAGKTSAGQAAATLLRDSQAADGGWEYTLDSGWGSDPNTTGLVLTALDAAGLVPTESPNAVFSSRQAGRTYLPDATTDAGAIAYTTVGDFAGPDILATSQSIPGLKGLNLRAVAPPVTWADQALAYTEVPDADAVGIAGWATTWLAAQSDADAISDRDLAWSILSFAANGTAKDQAIETYATLRNGALGYATNPGALGQAALAATVLGEDEDADLFADLIAGTLTTPVLTPLPVTPPKDVTDPKVALTTPKAAKKVSSWRTLRGTSSDASGVKSVKVGVVEKRDGSWYSYNGTTWKKRVSLAKARSVTKVITVTPTATGAWSLKVKKLTKGTLKVKVRGTDKAGNVSTWRTTTVTLTKK